MADTTEKLIRIKNNGSFVFEATIYHGLVCAFRGACSCTPLPQSQPKAPPRRAEASIILQPGQTSDPLPAAVIRIPQVKKASQPGGTLTITYVDAQVEEVR